MITNSSQKEYERLYYADKYIEFLADKNPRTARRKFDKLKVLRGKMRRLGFSDREVMEIEFIASARYQRGEGE